MPKQNFDHEHLTENDRMKIAALSFSMQIKDIAEELNVTPGAISYWLKQPEVIDFINEIREAKKKVWIEKVIQIDRESPQTDMFN